VSTRLQQSHKRLNAIHALAATCQLQVTAPRNDAPSIEIIERGAHVGGLKGAGERARRESQGDGGMAGAEIGGQEQPGTVIVPRMLEGQKRRIFDVRGRQGARISEQAS